MKRPYVHVNVAMTADGKIDSALRRGAAISSSADKRRVDELRASVDAVLVGGRTLLDEDPGLIVKSADLRAERVRKGLPENPAKVGVVSEIPAVAGADGVRPTNGIRPGAHHAPLQKFLTTGPARRLIYTTIRTASEQTALLKDAGAEVFVQDGKRVDLASMLASLHELGLRRLMVEGGGTLIAEFFRLGFVDELTIYIAPKIFGGASAPSLADGPGFLQEQAPGLELVSVKKFDSEGGVLVHYKVINPRNTGY
ncbi:MAG: dihydrofolate reductase family protein [Chloroflexi bacterium]|nr:dihydrofolate reductase family protein [Chloroflexota bacterium]